MSGKVLSRNLFGLPIQAMRMEQVLVVVDEAIAERRRLLIGVVNVAKLVKMRRDSALSSAVRVANLVLADGMGVVWASRLLRQPLPERVTGIDLMAGMLARSAQRGYRMYCLGATPEVLSTAIDRMRADYPGVHIVGQHHGYFSAQEEGDIAEQVRQARADILLVGITSPKKEQFLARWGERMQVPVCHGVGGSFDVVAGKVKRAPAIWQRLGMEWLYRVVQEPRRMWWRYLSTNTVFLGMLVSEVLRRFRPGQPCGHVNADGGADLDEHSCPPSPGIRSVCSGSGQGGVTESGCPESQASGSADARYAGGSVGHPQPAGAA